MLRAPWPIVRRSDPHDGDGIVASKSRGGFSVQFGKDVTAAFCARTGVQSVIRSHQLPKKQAR